jgi:hypothetical protein
MSLPWFRFYTEVLEDPKVQTLDPEDFKHWVNLLCLAAKNDGIIPEIGNVSFALRETFTTVSTVLERLCQRGLIDKLSGGPNGWHYAPHGWDKRQYKSDTSTDRVKRFRERSKTVTVTPPDTDTEQNKKKTPTVSKKSFTRPTIDDVRDYCDSRNNGIDPQAFIDHYEANGWKVGRNSMKDWKASVRTWERSRKERSQHNRNRAQAGLNLLKEIAR